VPFLGAYYPLGISSSTEVEEKVLVIIPANNEKGSVDKAIEDARDHVSRADIHSNQRWSEIDTKLQVGCWSEEAMASSRISVRVSSGNCFGIGGGPEALRTPFPRRLACNRRTSGNPGAGRLQKHSGVVRPVRRMSVFSVLSFSPQSFLP
jgi:hypothetical protein